MSCSQLVMRNEGISRTDRLKAAVATAVLQAFLAYILLAVFWSKPPGPAVEPLKVFQLTPEAVPPPVSIAAPAKTTGPEGAAAPANIRSRAAEIVSPTPVVPLIVPPTPVAVMDAAAGSDRTTGTADLPGLGTGSGGIGSGTGSGTGGLGDGGGRRRGTPPRKLKGHLKDSDYPRRAGEEGVGGTVSVIFAVESDGRVDDCRVTETSGYPVLDENTCRLILRRYRFAPALDSEGRPTRSRVTESHSWIIQQEPPAEQPAG